MERKKKKQIQNMYIIKKKHFMTKLGLFKKNTVRFNFQKSINAINRTEREKKKVISIDAESVFY